MKKDNPLVSVVMPAYNAEKYISEAIESILNQTFKDFEFIIVDDASTDGTWGIIQKYAEKDPRIVAVKNEKNIRVARTRNRGIEKAIGKYVANMDADDRSLPDRLSVQYDFLEAHSQDIDICIGNLNICNIQGVVQYSREYPTFDKDLRMKVYKYNPFPNAPIMCKREVFSELGGYDPNYIIIEDFDFWLRAGVRYKYGNCGKTVYDYRIYGESESHKDLRLTEVITFKLRWKALKIGYKASVGDVIYNIFHLFSYLIIPSRFKIMLFDLFRKYGVIK